MQTDIADNHIRAMAAGLHAKLGVRAQRFTVNQIADASDEAISTWLAIYMALSAKAAFGVPHNTSGTEYR